MLIAALTVTLAGRTNLVVGLVFALVWLLRGLVIRLLSNSDR